MTTGIREYRGLSRTPFYSLVFIVPLVVLYEILAVMINWESELQLRNGADVLLRQLLMIFGLGTPYALGILFAAGIAGAWVRQRYRFGTTQVNVVYLAGMLVESLLWAGFMLLFLAAADQLLIVTTTDTVLRTAFLAVGAGIYEEAVFRLLLVTGLAVFFLRVLHWHRQFAWGIAIGLSAALFSLFHYVGPAGEVFAWNSFVYRSVAGIILGLLFYFRGFGITVYAHTTYDLLVLGIQTVG
ncbi:MAG: CPBP family intramembrane metalloprotease [Fidelibacterota bacterium]|nr:MAG: CPBP family intramembrane metalloprotease [Candidatus Neomarinimicrobiota bacterium]